MKKLKTFIINLKKDKERKKYIEQQLNKLGIKNFEFIEAIYAKNITRKELKKFYDASKSKKEIGRELKLGEIGCALSHFKIYKKIIDEDLPFALIFEDDAIIDNEFYKIYKKIRREKKISWEFLTANYTIFDKSEKTRFSNYLKETYKNQKLQYFKNYILMILATFVDFIFENIGKFKPGIFPRFKPLYLLGGYFITKEGAKKLLSVDKKVFLPADILPERYRKKIDLKMYFIYPLLIKQNKNFETNIQNTEII